MEITLLGSVFQYVRLEHKTPLLITRQCVALKFVHFILIFMLILSAADVDIFASNRTQLLLAVFQIIQLVNVCNSVHQILTITLIIQHSDASSTVRDIL